MDENTKDQLEEAKAADEALKTEFPKAKPESLV